MHGPEIPFIGMYVDISYVIKLGFDLYSSFPHKMFTTDKMDALE